MFWKTKELLIVRCLLIAWLVSVVVAFLQLADYACRPGQAAEPRSAWPSETKLNFIDDHWNVLVFMHPKCPCSRASMTELQRVIEQLEDSNGQNIVTQFVFFHPEAESQADSEDWNDSELIRASSKLTDLAPWFDRGAVESRRFGATTSGHVMAYSPSGELGFSGGVTVRRSHEGDNAAAQALAEILDGSVNIEPTYPVFGCPITGCP